MESAKLMSAGFSHQIKTSSRAIHDPTITGPSWDLSGMNVRKDGTGEHYTLRL